MQGRPIMFAQNKLAQTFANYNERALAGLG